MQILSPSFDDLPCVVAKENVKINITNAGLVTWIEVDGKIIARIVSNGFIPIDIQDKREGR